MIADLIEQYLNQGKAEGWADSTIETRRQNLQQFGHFLQSRGFPSLADVKPRDVDAYILAMQARGVQENTRNKRAVEIRLFFRWLAEAGKILSNPARDITLPPDDEVELPPPPLDEDEIAEIIDGLPRRNVIDLRNRLHIELLYGCALRISESVALDIADIDLNNRTLRVVHGKGDKERQIPMMRGVMAAMRDWLALRRSLLRGPDNGALLLDRFGRRLTKNAFRLWLAKIGKTKLAKGKRIYPHLLRHSIAVHLLRRGADIRHVQEFLGHARLETTKVYLRLCDLRLKEDYDKAMPVIAIDA